MIKKYYHNIRIFMVCGTLSIALNACGPFFGSNDDSGTDIVGTINVFEGSAVDSDVNDPNSPYQSNDSLQNAQPVTNPVTLGGYVNQPQTGPAGRSYEAGDPDDYYSVTLLQDQQITLYMGNRNNSNAALDFYLYNSGDASVVESQPDVTTRHTFTVPAKGAYTIQVHAATGAANYNLTIGFGNTTLAASFAGTTHKQRPASSDFIPGEVIVRFKDDAATMARQLPAAVSMAGSLGLHRKGGAAGREMLFRISDQQTTLQALGIQQSASATDDIWQQKQDTLAIINALRQRPDVAYALPNYIVRPTLVPNDTYFPKQWHYNLINLPQAWDVTIGDRTPNVIVAVVDTGVLPDHPDLQDKLVPGYDFVVNRNGQNIELDNEPGIDPHPTDPGGSVAGSNFHGTHVTGTVAAATNNNAGVAGVGWNVKVMPLRALGADEGSLYDVGQAVRYAAGLDNDSGTKPDQPADIINLSLGAVLDPAVVDQLREPFDLARQAGVIVIAAAGNDSVSADFFPASLDSVISVNAVDMNKQLASYSNFGPTIDLSAPGGDSGDIDGDGVFDGVYSLGADDSGTSLVYGYTLAAGTSMASPHVSGVAALMKSVLPDMTPDDFDHFLKTGTITEDLGDPGRDDTFGYGLIDARKAVVAAASGQVPQLDPVAIVSPTSLNLTPDRTAVDINIRNGGDGTLSLPAPEPISNDSGGWLQVTPVDVDNNGLGRYRVAINSANVPPDATTLAAVITITTDVNTLQVPVIAQLQVIPFANNAGTQYVLLLDDSYQRQYGIEAQVSDGTYRFRFNNVAKGIYYLITGSDINNNNQICDPGESCGQYPTLDHPRIIEITADSIYFVTDESAPGGTVNATPSAAGLEFETGYHVTISSQNAAIQRSPVNR